MGPILTYPDPESHMLPRWNPQTRPARLERGRARLKLSRGTAAVDRTSRQPRWAGPRVKQL